MSESLAIDLVSGKSRRNDYRKNPNPPILHRKELFLLDDYPIGRLFSGHSIAEEKAGLFAEPQTIGFRWNWEKQEIWTIPWRK